MELDLFQIDAFADRAFAGNPAAVVPVTEWPSDEVMKAIATENNLSETAFIILGEASLMPLRWFTPAVEVPLCGHATLAAAHAVMTELRPELREVRFETRDAGVLTVLKTGDGAYEMDFPARPATLAPTPDGLTEALGVVPEATATAHKWMAVLPDESAVRQVQPNMARLASLECEGVIVTAPGKKVDFVSRFFGPRVGVPEDPVTGSAHCVLAPYWAERLGRGDGWMTARQVSARGGDLRCRQVGDRVVLSGSAITVIRGRLRF